MSHNPQATTPFKPNINFPLNRKVFMATYDYIPPGPGGYECRELYHIVITANVYEEALGLALEWLPDSWAHNWTIREIDTFNVGVHEHE